MFREVKIICLDCEDSQARASLRDEKSPEQLIEEALIELNKRGRHQELTVELYE